MAPGLCVLSGENNVKTFHISLASKSESNVIFSCFLSYFADSQRTDKRAKTLLSRSKYEDHIVTITVHSPPLHPRHYRVAANWKAMTSLCNWFHINSSCLGKDTACTRTDTQRHIISIVTYIKCCSL